MNSLNFKTKEEEEDLTDMLDDNCTYNICSSNLIEQMYFGLPKTKIILKYKISERFEGTMSQTTRCPFFFYVKE